MRHAPVALLGVFVILSVAGPSLVRRSPVRQNLELRFASPGTEGYLLGTDEFGRDVAARLVWGTRAAFITSGSGVLIAAAIGIPLGLLAALERRILDRIISLLIDATLSFPGVLLAVALIAALGSGALQISIALGIMFAPLFARTVRAQTLAVSREGYVELSHGVGSSALRTVGMHILPNVIPSTLVIATSSFALCITIEAALSFLGLGSQPPTPTWGLMLREARNYLQIAPHLALLPGMTLALCVFSLNSVGDRIAARFSE